MKHPEYMRFVINTFRKYRSKLIVNDDELYENGTIYYMNGNDGTDFDWDCNHRMCEFYSFYNNEEGYMKLCINSNNTASIFMYKKNEMLPTIEETIKFPYCASTFAHQMYSIADYEEKYNSAIDNLDWNKEYVSRRWS